MRYVKAAAVAAVTLGAVALFLYYQSALRDALALVGRQAVHFLLFAALAWAAYAAGRIIVKGAFRASAPWEVEAAVGFVAFGVAAFALAATHLLYAWVVRGGVLIVIALSAPTLWRLVRETPARLARWRREADAGAFVLLALGTPFVLALALRAAQPPVDWDVLVYHLYLPKVFAHAHSFVYLPRMAYASVPLGAQMIYTWAYSWGGLGVANAVGAALNGLVVVATWRLARAHLGGFWAAFAALLVFFIPNVFGSLPSANLLGILAALAVMALTLYVKGVRTRGDAALVGLLLGAALTVHFTSLYALIAFAPLVVFDLIKKRITITSAVLIAAAAILVYAPWAAKAYVERGNPVFPALYDVFGGRDLPAAVAARAAAWQMEIGMGRGVSDYLALPYRLSFMAGGGYGRFDGQIWPFLIPLFLLACIWFRKWKLVAYGTVAAAAWAALGSQNVRFLGSALAVLATVAAGVFATTTRDLGRTAQNWLKAGAAALVFVLGFAMNATTVYYALQSYTYLLTGDADTYLTLTLPTYEADKWVNENLPPDANVLMVFDNNLLYLERPAVYDFSFEASETLLHVQTLNNAEEVAAYVKGLGVSYVMYCGLHAENYWRYYEPRTRALWESYLREYTTRVATTSYHDIRAVNP